MKFFMFLYIFLLYSLLESSYSTLNSLLSQECGIGLISVMLTPSVPNQTHSGRGPRGLLFALSLSALWILCCWER